MNWVCDFCATVNAEEDDVCFACDRKRSKASIDEARRKKRNEKLKKWFLIAYKIAFNIGWYTFWASVICSMVILGYLIIARIATGEFNGIFTAFATIFASASRQVAVVGTNISGFFTNAFNHIAAVFMTNIPIVNAKMSSSFHSYWLAALPAFHNVLSNDFVGADVLFLKIWHSILEVFDIIT